METLHRRGLKTLSVLQCVGLVVALAAATPVEGDPADRYQNPILFADYSDPDVIRVGAAYFMTASSFSSVPGLPILRSSDLSTGR